MSLSVKTLFAGAAVLTALVATAPASAATIVVPYENGPFSLLNPLGTLPATKLIKGNDYDFTFTMVQPLVGSITSVQVQAQFLGGGVSTPELIQYQLYAGTPGSGTWLAQSSNDFSPVVALNFAAGDYYIEVTSDEISKSKEVASGSITTAPAPEPASWAMMLVGFGALGFAMRRRNAALSV